jgi:hypothetical protein
LKEKEKECKYIKERKVQKGWIFLEECVPFYYLKNAGSTLQKEDKLFRNLHSSYILILTSLFLVRHRTKL